MNYTLKELIDHDLDYIKFLYRKQYIDFDLEAWDYVREKAGRKIKRYGCQKMIK